MRIEGRHVMHKQYQEWLSKTHHVDFGDSSNRRDDHVCKSATEDVSENKTTITRNLPSGRNIFETQTTKITFNKDGTTKKSVIIGQTANITTRKREHDANEDPSEVKRKIRREKRLKYKKIWKLIQTLRDATT